MYQVDLLGDQVFVPPYTVTLDSLTNFECSNKMLQISDPNPTAVRSHMEPGWAAVELLHTVKEKLGPTRTPERASQGMLDAIRVLPEPVAGDLFVTCAARGDISAILYYFHEGEWVHLWVSK